MDDFNVCDINISMAEQPFNQSFFVGISYYTVPEYI